MVDLSAALARAFAKSLEISGNRGNRGNQVEEPQKPGFGAGPSGCRPAATAATASATADQLVAAVAVAQNAAATGSSSPETAEMRHSRGPVAAVAAQIGASLHSFEEPPVAARSSLELEEALAAFDERAAIVELDGGAPRSGRRALPGSPRRRR